MENSEMDMGDEYEPPKKIMKYEHGNSNRTGWKTEIELVQFKIGYLTKKGNILLENKNIEDNVYLEHDDREDEHDNVCDDDNTLLIDNDNKPFEVYLLNFQTFEGGEAYLVDISNISKIDINKGYTINEIFNNFIRGDYFIGILHYYYKNNYENGIITDVSTFDDKNNDEIRLHYTKDRSCEGNIAWRNMTWDLFEECVPK